MPIHTLNYATNWDFPISSQQLQVWAHNASRVAYHRYNLLKNSITSNMLYIPLNLEKEAKKYREKMISTSPRSKILKAGPTFIIRVPFLFLYNIKRVSHSSISCFL